MTEVLLGLFVFILVFVLHLCYSQTRSIYKEQNQLIKSLRGEARFLLKVHRRDIELLDWADKAGYYNARFESIREELRSAMEEDNAQNDH